MARPRTITNEQILTAAGSLFLERGPEVTTAEIAARAGVSEGTLFRRFPTKQALFLAAIGRSTEPPWFKTVDEIKNCENLAEGLAKLSNEIIDFFSVFIPKMSLLMSSQLSKGKQPELTETAIPVRVIKSLLGLFYHWQRNGRIRPCDPEICARMFAGSMMHFIFSSHSGLNEHLPMPRQTYIRGVVSMMLSALKVSE